MTVPAADNLRIAIQSMWPDLHDDNEVIMENAADLLDAIDALHQLITNPFDHSPNSLCGYCLRPWPCPEHLMLHPKEKP